MPAVLNAANEVAVDAFLRQELSFTAIPALIEGVMQRHAVQQISLLETVLDADRWARDCARSLLSEDSL